MKSTPDGTIDFARLKELTGYDRPGDVARELRHLRIQHFHGRRKVWTTVDLMNAARGLEKDPAPSSGYPSDIV